MTRLVGVDLDAIRDRATPKRSNRRCATPHSPAESDSKQTGLRESGHAVPSGAAPVGELGSAIYAALLLERGARLLEAVGVGPAVLDFALWVAFIALTVRWVVPAWRVYGRARVVTALIALSLSRATPLPSAVVLRPRPAM